MRHLLPELNVAFAHLSLMVALHVIALVLASGLLQRLVLVSELPLEVEERRQVVAQFIGPHRVGIERHVYVHPVVLLTGGIGKLNERIAAVVVVAQGSHQ